MMMMTMLMTRTVELNWPADTASPSFSYPCIERVSTVI